VKRAGSIALIAAIAFSGAAGLNACRAAAQSPAPTVRVGLLRGGSYDVTTMPLETYVGRVLAGEAARESPPAALEALAIAVRTYAMANRGRHKDEGFDFCDQTHCQVLRAATQTTERAAQATGGQVLLFDGAPASIYYSASCGGHTERPSAVWPGAIDPPYLPAKLDEACEGQPEWEAEIRSADLQRALASSGFRGTLRGVRVARRNESGRVAVLLVDGLTPAEISAQDLRIAMSRMPGVPQVQSAAFELRKTGDAYRFTGHGSGHGVGLCVIGSTRLAAGGAGAAAILERYFPGTTLGGGAATMTRSGGTPAPAPAAGSRPPAPASPPGRPEVAAWLPAGDEPEREALLAAASAARDELAAALGVPPPRLTIRVHPTAAEYERATLRAWFTSGALVDGDIHLVPLATLRGRGMLERTIRRQVAQAMTWSALEGKPTWVKDGAALYFGDGGTGAAVGRVESRGPCPTETELAQPVSAGALADAWARARACFARQIASGRAWREVR
jgi:stage II sporulation protein D